MARIYLENLPEEYRRKLCARQLTRETIDALACSVSEKCQLRRRGFRRAAILCTGAAVLVAVLTALSPAAGGAAALLWSFAAMVLMEALILAALYFLAVTRVPRQFVRCLKEGYPELEMVYAYEQLVDGTLAKKKRSQQLPFSLRIEDVFRLNGSGDIVVAGFAHGLIERGNSVWIIDRDDPARERVCAIVTAIEKNGKGAAQAADCAAALRIRKGAELGLAPGMELYREV
jgi:hypothetical protein